MKHHSHKNKFSVLFLSIILLFTHQVFCQSPRFGNGYENLSRRTTGGKIRTGDTIDIKMAVHIPWGFNGGASGRVYKVRFLDSIPTNTIMLSGAADSIRILTNEDVTYSRYTPIAGDDAASYVASPLVGEYQIRINLGASPTAPTNTNLTDVTGANDINLTSSWPYGDSPKWWTGHIFSTSFRVRVTGVSGDTIRLTGGKFVYRLSSSGADVIVSGVPYQIIIGTDDQLCSGALGTNYAGESGGSFGSGTTLNRLGGPSTLVPDYGYTSNVSGSGNISINDGNYGIVNNISPWSSTNRTARRVPSCSGGVIASADSCKYRMFGGNWEIEGDHTGSTGRWGNNPPAAGTTGGYMLLVNADYITSDAYEHTVSGLCPNTYYQFSAWFRNVCRTCGGDYNLTNTYRPGVMPSLTFAVDGIDRYSTGEIDTTGWIQKAFLFKTGMTQTSAVFSIRNNSQGGGGNDWAIDDINIATCGPTSAFNYKPLLGCNNGTLVSLADTIQYAYNNTYSWYKWERSTDNGGSWGAPPTPTTGNAIPILSGGYHQYVTNYPPFLAYAADSGHIYRVLVATTSGNLSSSGCSFADGNSVLLKLIDCSMILDAGVISFSAKLQRNDKPMLNWVVSTENNLLRYEIERSTNGFSFSKIGQQNARNDYGAIEYFYADEESISKNTYYRLKIISSNGMYKYSRVVVVNKSASFQVLSVLNPFSSNISVDIVMPEDGEVKMKLYSKEGKLIGTENRKLYKGANSIIYNGFLNLSNGIYIVSFENRETNVKKQVTKLK